MRPYTKEDWSKIVDLLNQRERALGRLAEGIARLRDEGRFGGADAKLRQEIDRLLADARRSSGTQG